MGDIEGITDDEVAKLVRQQAQTWVDWDRKEQGTWPTKMMVDMWFKNETNLLTMIDLLEITKEELETAAYKINRQKCEGEAGSQS